MNVLTVRHISKTYAAQPQPAVENISFSLRKGELLGLVGESGSGKTTLLRLVAGLEDSDSGQILLKNEPVAGPLRRLVPGHPHIRLVHQDFKLSPNITVLENIAYALRTYDAAYRESRLTQVMRLCELTGLQHRLPRQLSGGEMQRAALATALADEPALLLLDEPFSNVDAVRRQTLRHEITDILRRSRTTAIFVTHDTAEALALSDRVAVLQSGGIVQIGTPRQVYSQPVSPYVASLFGHANVFPAGDLQKIRLPASQMPGFQANASLCIRAENIALAPKADADFAGKLLKTSYLGMYEIWEVELTEEMKWQVLAFGNILFPDRKVFLKVDWAKAHMFQKRCP